MFLNGKLIWRTGERLINFTYYIFFELIFYGEDTIYLIIGRKDPVNLNNDI
jgi:hypothetical protein